MSNRVIGVVLVSAVGLAACGGGSGGGQKREPVPGGPLDVTNSLDAVVGPTCAANEVALKGTIDGVGVDMHAHYESNRYQLADANGGVGELYYKLPSERGELKLTFKDEVQRDRPTAAYATLLLEGAVDVRAGNCAPNFGSSFTLTDDEKPEGTFEMRSLRVKTSEDNCGERELTGSLRGCFK